MATLIAKSMLNWELFDEETEWHRDQEDLDFLCALDVPSIENVMEYAARVCYDSTQKMGTDPGFIRKKIVQTGHHDVIEHGYATVMVHHNELEHEKYLTREKYNDMILVGGNIRAWYDLRHKYDWIHNVIGPFVPSVFEHEESIPTEVYDFNIGPEENVMLLTASANYGKIGHATFLVSGISRACANQFVRHRLLSFSQRSQRYVEESSMLPIIPSSALGNKEAHAELMRIYNECNKSYIKLRELGLKRQDARSVLPNMFPTKMVVSGDIAGWNHFISLRTERAAQDEIRYVASQIKRILDRVW